MIGEIDMRGKGFWETMHLSGFKRGIGVEGYVKSPARVVKIEKQ